MGCTNYINILKGEVVPALGCTEPIAVALASAKVKEELNQMPEKIEVFLSGNILKNGMGVGIPGTGMTGLHIAAALGAAGGESSQGLEVLKNVSEEHINIAKEMVYGKKIDIQLKDGADKLFVEVRGYANMDVVVVTIKHRHNNICKIEKNGVVIEDETKEQCTAVSSNDNTDISVGDIYHFATSVDFSEIKFLLQGAEMNKRVAEEGLNKNYGLGVGKSIVESIKKGLLSDDIQSYAMAYTAAGADARMDGCKYPVMSSAGSGNQGLTAILPVVATAEKLGASSEQLARALAISHLTTIHIKSQMGRLSALCGCGVAASIGASCAITYLLGGNLEHLKHTIKNMIGNVSGMICDGAKPGCALKLTTAVSAAVQSALLALNGVEISDKDGIVEENVENTISNLGKLASIGMVATDKVILDIMLNKDCMH